jgi:predicted ATPase
MLIHRLKVSGLLSFGRKGIDLPMRKLNVLIGPNGSGKSNLLEVINLFREAPSALHSISGPIMADGGISEWLWKEGSKGEGAPMDASLSCTMATPKKGEFFQHELTFSDANQLPNIWMENIAVTKLGNTKPQIVYTMITSMGGWLSSGPGKRARKLKDAEINPSSSILAQVRDPGRYKVFQYLQDMYSSIQLYRDWSFGPHASLRKPGKTDERSDLLSRSGQNLAVVAAAMSGKVKKQVIKAMQALYADIRDIHVRPVVGGSLQLYLEEANEVEIPASRLSDGTLRYLSLLIILLDAKPPPLIVIEEPEMGLHPDVIPQVARLLQEASERTQLVVTTHSRMLIDALGDDPASVIVCEKHDGESVFERLDPIRLKDWLEKYSLGDLWSKGELGGNRW